MPAISPGEGALAAGDSVSAELVYEHEINADGGTYVRDLANQIQGQIDGLNQDLVDGGIRGLRDKITNYQLDKTNIDRTGRSFARTFKRRFNRARGFPSEAPVLDDATGERMAPLHEQDMALGGDPRGVTRMGIARNDFIIGGQADDLADQISTADDSVTRFTWRLVVRGLGRGGTRTFAEGDNIQDIPKFLARP